MSRPWMPLYVSDYLGDTRRLTTLQHGAYLLLIMEYWQHGGLPDDDNDLAEIVGLELSEWLEMRPRIARLFKDGWRHKRIDEELAKADEISTRRKASAVRRWSKRTANEVQDDANALQGDMNCNARAGVPQPQPHPHSSLRSEETRDKRASLANDAAGEFERFWSAWPNKVGKPAAAKAFFKVRGEAAAIMAGIPRYIADTQAAGRPWLNPATFLNQRRWEDSPAPQPMARAGPATERRNPAFAAFEELMAERYGSQDDENAFGQNPDDFDGPTLDLNPQ